MYCICFTISSIQLSKKSLWEVWKLALSFCTHTWPNDRHIQTCSYFAKGNELGKGEKNSIKMIFIVEKFTAFGIHKITLSIFLRGTHSDCRSGFVNELPEMMPESRHGFLKIFFRFLFLPRRHAAEAIRVDISDKKKVIEDSILWVTVSLSIDMFFSVFKRKFSGIYIIRAVRTAEWHFLENSMSKEFIEPPNYIISGFFNPPTSQGISI